MSPRTREAQGEHNLSVKPFKEEEYEYEDIFQTLMEENINKKIRYKLPGSEETRVGVIRSVYKSPETKINWYVITPNKKDKLNKLNVTLFSPALLPKDGWSFAISKDEDSDPPPIGQHPYPEMRSIESLTEQGLRPDWESSTVEPLSERETTEGATTKEAALPLRTDVMTESGNVRVGSGDTVTSFHRVEGI